MKINKQAWREMIAGREMNSLADLHERDLRGLPREIQQINPLPDAQLGDEICEPKINHPKHYNAGKYETIAVIEDWNLDFHCGNAVKYISRHKYKGSPKQDIEKAIWYLQRYLETLDENT
tara:strand:- start:19 stop:378 length:360 start_codon:yes stop_codon:yes gene_type:complete